MNSSREWEDAHLVYHYQLQLIGPGEVAYLDSIKRMPDNKLGPSIFLASFPKSTSSSREGNSPGT
jgi:hypothetical protein